MKIHKQAHSFLFQESSLVYVAFSSFPVKQDAASMLATLGKEREITNMCGLMQAAGERNN